MISITKFGKEIIEIHPLITEINQVILVGTLINDAFTFQSGIQNLSIKTYDASREK